MDISWPCCGGIAPRGCGGGAGGDDNERVAGEEEREPQPPTPTLPSPPPLVTSPPGMKPPGRGSSSSSLAFEVAPRVASLTGRGAVRHRGSPSTDCISRNVVTVSSTVVVAVLQFDWSSLFVAPPPSSEEDPPPSLPSLFLRALRGLLLGLPGLLTPGVGMARSLTDRSRDAVRMHGGSSITFFCVKYGEKQNATGITEECTG